MDSRFDALSGALAALPSAFVLERPVVVAALPATEAVAPLVCRHVRWHAATGLIGDHFRRTSGDPEPTRLRRIRHL